MSRGILIGVAGGLLLTSAGMTGWYFLSNGADAGASEAIAAEVPAPEESEPARAPSVDGAVTLAFEDRSVSTTWADLGAVARGGEVVLDDDVAVQKLLAIKDQLDRAPANARMDLEKRELVAEQPGYAVDVYGALAVLRARLHNGASKVTLPGVETAPDVTRADLGNIDISTVLGHFSTKFAISEKSRNDNLKLAASKLDGYVLMPGVEFSFNDVVGARTEKEGYKIAHVITSGEMVDGLAGGTCQISTTLHGASFFAGLEIVKSLPHSRPSTYVTMGLDATVVYPVTDLKLRNPYDFPVVIHYTVGRGESQVEILGKERPYDKIVFERQIEEELPFDTVSREDDTLPVGSLVIEQEGFPGYKVKRFRKYVKDGKVVKTDKWSLRYAPVTEYSRMGINPDPNLPMPKQPKSHGPKAPKKEQFAMSQ